MRHLQWNIVDDSENSIPCLTAMIHIHIHIRNRIAKSFEKAIIVQN